MVIVVFFEMLRATFLARFFTMKLPATEIHVVLLGERRVLMLSMKASTIACTCTFSTPVLLAISLTISAFVMFILYLN